MVETAHAVIARGTVRGARRAPHPTGIAKAENDLTPSVDDAALAHVGEGDDGGGKGGGARNDSGIGCGAEIGGPDGYCERNGE